MHDDKANDWGQFFEAHQIEIEWNIWRRASIHNRIPGYIAYKIFAHMLKNTLIITQNENNFPCYLHCIQLSDLPKKKQSG